MKNIDTILFDLDGTLINTNEVIINSFFHTFSVHLPAIEMTREIILTFIGPSLHQTFGNYTEDESKIEEMITTYRNHYVEIEFGLFEIYPNVINTLEILKEQGYNLGIVTTKLKAAAFPSFHHYNFSKYFPVVIGFDDVEHPKPHREPIDKALSLFNSHKGAIMIGDNQSDILSGKNADILSCGVSWSIKGKEYLQQVNPDYMIDDMYDLLSILETLNK